MKKLQRLLLFATAAVAAGCATTGQFRGHMDQFLGRPISEAEQAFGYNYAVKELEEGNRVFTWATTKTGVVPGYQSPTIIESHRSGEQTRTTVTPGTSYPSYVYRDVCEFSFIADNAGKIVKWSARGDGCRGRPGGTVLQSDR
jgi:hypothetical protein